MGKELVKKKRPDIKNLSVTRDSNEYQRKKGLESNEQVADFIE